MDKNKIKARLEYLRGELQAERMSYGELAELQSLKHYIEPGDVELLEAAGVPEVLPDTIEISWHIDDVKGQDESLTDQEAREILQMLKDQHDATLGINWDVIDCVIDMYKQDKEEAAKTMTATT